MDFASTPNNIRRLGGFTAAALFALLSGCFSEPVGGETGGTGGTCDLGSFGCPCLAGVCEPDLECAPSDICIPADCTPGTAVCECDGQGRCGPGLDCTGNVCLPQGGTTITTTSSDSDTSTSTTGTSMPTDTMPTDTMPSTTSVDTGTSTTEPETTDTTSATTDPPPSCPETAATCSGCFACTQDNECETQQAECDGQPGCNTIASCMQACAVDGLCFNDCCEGEIGGAIAAALALQTCREDTCIAGACRSYAAYGCN